MPQVAASRTRRIGLVLGPGGILGSAWMTGAHGVGLALLARSSAPPLDEVFVLAPLASHAYDHPLDPVAVAERGFRRWWTLALDHEVAAVRATGTRVTVLTPGPADLAAMGGNLMDPHRRRLVLERSCATSADALAVAEGAAA